MFKKLFKKPSPLKPKAALKRFRKHNKDGTVQSVLSNRRTDAYGHTFGPKTGRKRKAPVTRGPLRSVTEVKTQAPKVKAKVKVKAPMAKDERKPKKRSFIPMGSGRHGLFRMFRKK
jgi:hypothetical protein